MGALAAGAVALALLAGPVPVEHVHSSSRYDRSATSLAAAARSYARTADLVTWTEIDNDRRARAVRLPGWRRYTPAGTDVGASWNRSTWQLRAAGTRRLSALHFTTQHGYRSPTQRAAVLVLDSRALSTNPHDKAGRLLVLVAHLPSGVEYGDHFRPGVTRRVAVWRDAIAHLGELVPALRHRWQPDLVLVVADWNVDVRRSTWRGYLRRVFPSLRLTWRGPLPRAGTHAAGRLIDATLTNGRGRARLLRDDSSSDHRPYAESLDVVRRER